MEPEAHLLVLRGRAGVLAEEACAPARGARDALQHGGRARVALDHEEAAGALLAEEVEGVLPGQPVHRDEPGDGGLDVVGHRHAVEEEQVGLRAVAALEGDPALDANEPRGVLNAPDETLVLPGVRRRGLHARGHAASAGHHLDLLLTVDARLDPLDDDVHLAEGNGAVVQLLAAGDDPVLGHRHAALVAHLGKGCLVVQARHHLQALAEELNVGQAGREPVLGHANEEGLVDRRHREDEVDLLAADQRLQVVHPLAHALGVQRRERRSRIASRGDGAGAHGLVVRDHDATAELLEGTDGMQSLGLPPGGHQDGLACKPRGRPAADEAFQQLQQVVQAHTSVPNAVGNGTEEGAESARGQKALHFP
mmetsp:Transcript_128057/g.398793  ORF Transcript_128057/g.398793 Transcript_128057/m.398793 type:complete len:366 (-) Transcript_128057:53-1150(-)